MHSIPLTVYILAYRVYKGLCWDMLEHLECPTGFSLGYDLHCEIQTAGTVSCYPEFWKDYIML